MYTNPGFISSVFSYILILVCAIREVVVASEGEKDGSARLSEEIAKGLGWTFVLFLHTFVSKKHVRRARISRESSADSERDRKCKFFFL